MTRTITVDFTGIEKEQALTTAPAPLQPAKADQSHVAIVSKNMPLVKQQFPENRWVNWGINPDKLKLPYNPETLTPAKAGQPETWGSFDIAFNNVKRGKAKGIGFQFDGTGLCGVDLDHAINPETGEVAAWATEIIETLGSYTEISPSGTGFHIILNAPGFKPEKKKKPIGSSGMIEIYSEERYFTITGNIFEERNTIRKRKTSLSSVYKKYIERNTEKGADFYMEQAMKNQEFLTLWNGGRPKADESADDSALMWRLAYWCNKDAAEMERQFLASPHVQFKDAAHIKKMNRGGSRPYLSDLINYAINNQPKTAAEDDKAGTPPVLNTEDGGLPYPYLVTLKNGSTRPAETLDNFKVCLARYGLTISYDCISKEVVPPKAFTEKYSSVGVHTALLSHCQDLCALEQIPKSRDRVAGWLSTVANENRVNPVQQYLEKLPATSGEAGIQHLFSCLKLSQEITEPFAYMLLKKWLIQCVAMAYNNEGSYGADGVLVLQGSQGMGKTSFFRTLCKGLTRYFKEGAEQNSDKDKLIENTRYWITELGELERTTLKDMDALKAFLTSGYDEYRAPYGVSAVRYPRYTSFCGTVNGADFLKEAGRRFFVIPLKDIDLDELKKVIIKKVWAEAVALWKADADSFRLNKKESTAVTLHTNKFTKVGLEEQVVMDALDFSAPVTKWEWKKASALARQLGGLDAAKLSRTLRKIGYEKGNKERPMRFKTGHTEFLVPPVIPQY